MCGWGYGCDILNRFGGEGLDFHDRVGTLVVVGIWGWRVRVRWKREILRLFDLALVSYYMTLSMMASNVEYMIIFERCSH